MKKKTIFKFKSLTCKLLSAIFLSVCIIFSICVYYSFAEVPCKINYQGRLIENNVPVDGTKTMKFTIYNSAVGGNELWTSGNVDITVYNGLFRYVLGEGFIGVSPVDDLSSIDWTAGQELYLQVIVDGEPLTPLEAIYAYPYAINSHLLEGATKEYFLNISGEEQTKQGNLNIMGDVGIGTTNPLRILDIGTAGGARSPSLRLSDDRAGGRIWQIETRNSTGNLFIGDVTAGGERVVIDANGNVGIGIGTTNPGAKLEVAGDILSDTVGYDSEGAYRYCKINGNKTKVYTKYLTGTLDTDSNTDVAHGVTAANILAVSYIIYSSYSSWYYVGEIFEGSSEGRDIYTIYDSTNIKFSDVGSEFRGQAYRIRIDYRL